MPPQSRFIRGLFSRQSACPTLARLSHLEGIFCLRARKFLLLSTSALRKSAKTGQVKTLPLF
jgi:hypothetical protein